VGAQGSSVASGSPGGAGGSGGAISFNLEAPVTTTGAGAGGVVAQSIGGGGGVVGFDSGGTQAPVVASASLGGAASGSGGSINATISAPVSTSGVGAPGVTVQSVGGGGGQIATAGVNTSATLTLGSSAGASGSGGAVALTLNAPVTTTGAGSAGVLVQSVGGGGGFALPTSAAGTLETFTVVPASNGGGGSGGALNVAINSPITVTGAGASGVIAQSVGGGGGLVGAGNYSAATGVAAPFSGSLGGAGSGAAVTLAVNANVVATGANANALVAQSTGGTGAASIALNIGAVTVTGGAGGHAVAVLGGGDNTISNAGELSTADGKTGMVIEAVGGNNAITNSGMIVGSIDLGSGANSFQNVDGGVFLAGPVVNLGLKGVEMNAGQISPGGVGILATLAVTGSFNATSTSNYFVDLDYLSKMADQITATGSASLSGKVTLNVMNTGYATPGTRDTPIVTAAGGVTASNLSLIATDTAVATYTLSNATATTEDIHSVVDFAPAGLTASEAAVGEEINKIQTAGTSPKFVSTAAALYAIPTVAELAQTYNLLGGAGVSAVQTATLSALDGFQTALASELDSSPQERLNGHAIGARPSRSLAQGGQLWLQAVGSDSKLAGVASEGSQAVVSQYAGMVGGWDFSPTAQSRVGVAIGGEPGMFNVDNEYTSGKVQTAMIGLYGSVWGGPWSGRFDIAYGHNHDNYDRAVGVLGTGGEAHGSFAGNSFSGYAEAGRSFPETWGYLRPLAAINVAHIDLNAYQETPDQGSSGVYDLAFAAHHLDSVRSSLGAEVATRWAVDDRLEFRPFLRAVWSHEFESTERTTTAAFVTAPGYDFDEEGARGVRDAGRFDIGAILTGLKNLDFELRAGTIAAARYQGLDGEVGLKWRW
jgi:outer membrane autotransporter protein